jgi:hypothetical protein
MVPLFFALSLQPPNEISITVTNIQYEIANFYLFLTFKGLFLAAKWMFLQT